MDLDSAADELYAVSPDEFVQRRKQLVAEARAARDRPLAKAIDTLRRPTRSAWLVNLLARGCSAEVRDLLDLGAALAEAQSRASADDLRRLSRDRHHAVEALVRRSVELAAGQGHPATDATRHEVTLTLQAALADPTVAELVRQGRVTQPVSYGGFGPLIPSEAPPTDVRLSVEPAAKGPPNVEPTAAEPPAEQPRASAEAPMDRARQAAETDVAVAEAALSASRLRTGEAEQAAEQATAAADELADRVDTLREQLAEAEAQERLAREAARAARREHQHLQRADAEAEQALAEARRRLTELGAAEIS